MDVVFPGSAALWAPERLVMSAWLGHIPFAFWLVTTHQPKVVVELGTHSGASYMAFCQAIEKGALPAAAYAIDTWRGDEQAGAYGEDVFAELAAYHNRRYLAFSRLVRSTFDQAVDHFADGSIDLLHIDGYHTYESVKHDFVTWSPKLSSRAIVLLHDINVRERDFGVWRLWEELIPHHPHFAFHHHHGLGVLGFTGDPPPALQSLIAVSHDEAAATDLRGCFARLGHGVQAEFNSLRLAAEVNVERTRRVSTGAERDQLKQRMAKAEVELAQMRAKAEAELAQMRAKAEAVAAELAATQQARDLVQGKFNARSAESAIAHRRLGEVAYALRREQRRRAKLLKSVSWQVTRPLRSMVDLLVRPFRKNRRRSDGDAGKPGLPPLLPAYFLSVLKPAKPLPFKSPRWGAVRRVKNARVCCLVHMYYPDLWEEMAGYVNNLKGIDHDVFVNFVDTTVTEAVLTRAAADFPAAKLVVSPNSGRDAGGIFRLLSDVDLNRYASVLVIHGKRSVTIKPEYGDLWRRALIEPLIGSPVIARLNAALISADSTVGAIGSAACHSVFVGDNARNTAILGERLGIAPEDRNAPFVAGSMFFIRPAHMGQMLTALRGLEFLNSDSPASANSIDGHLEHAVERAYGALVKSAKQRIVWRDTRVSKLDLGTIGRAAS